MKPKIILMFFLIFYSLFSIIAFDFNNISLPKGFKIELYAQGLNSPRGLTVTNNDTLYIGSKSGFVYKLTTDNKVTVIANGLNGPIGVDYSNGDLYVSEIDNIRVFKNIDLQKAPYISNIISLEIPNKKWHGWKYLKVGPDGKIYINIGAPCNTCLTTGYLGTISRMDIDGKNFEVYARGIRNSVGFDWAPFSGELWFTDNGPDKFGDNFPGDELNRIEQINQHFGFPFIHGDNVKDPDFYKEIKEIKVTIPEWLLPAHVAALGMRFYTGDMFPKEYKNGIFIAEHGSWNRSTKIGYRISFIPTNKGKAKDYLVFASGWENDNIVLGRPVDIEQLSDGSLIISDDFSGNLYRVFY